MDKNKGGKIFYVFIGVVIAVPLFLLVGGLLVSADAVFRDMTLKLFEDMNLLDMFRIFCMICGMFLAVYGILAYTCEKTLKEEVADKRKGEPILAITVTGMLTAMYVVFSGIQIVYLFFGQMELPKGYTYAEYAREGFFQLLAVSILNLIIVLVCMAYFKESKILKIVLAVMSACTFVMIASSAVRMIIYIQYYYLTFLRVFVLWALLVLFLLFIGVVWNIFGRGFALFRYSCIVVTCCYLVLSFARPDYWIARVNIANTEISYESDNEFFAGKEYRDYSYLAHLSADAAPVLLPWIAENAEALGVTKDSKVFTEMPRYVSRMVDVTKQYDSALQFNVSRYMAARQLEELGLGKK